METKTYPLYTLEFQFLKKNQRMNLNIFRLSDGITGQNCKKKLTGEHISIL